MYEIIWHGPGAPRLGSRPWWVQPVEAIRKRWKSSWQPAQIEVQLVSLFCFLADVGCLEISVPKTYLNMGLKIPKPLNHDFMHSNSSCWRFNLRLRKVQDKSSDGGLDMWGWHGIYNLSQRFSSHREVTCLVHHQLGRLRAIESAPNSPCQVLQ